MTPDRCASRTALPVAALLVTLLLPLAAARADGSADVGTDDRPIERLVVSERHPTELAKAPGSLSAYSGEALRAAGVASTLDLPALVPGLVLTTNSIFAQPYVRGVGSDLISAGADSAVAVFVDGVYQPRPAGARTTRRFGCIQTAGSGRAGGQSQPQRTLRPYPRTFAL